MQCISLLATFLVWVAFTAAFSIRFPTNRSSTCQQTVGAARMCLINVNSVVHHSHHQNRQCCGHRSTLMMATEAADKGQTKMRMHHPRLMAMFRPPSRHTYGFQEGDAYDLPHLELQTLIHDRDYKHIHIDFIPVTETERNSATDNSLQLQSTLQNQSRNQLKKKKLKKNYNKGGTQSLYWLESSDTGDNVDIISTAVSRAVLTHALFCIEYSGSFSNDDWVCSVNNNKDAHFHESIDKIDVISMSNTNMSNEERSNLLRTISILLQQNGKDDFRQYFNENHVLIYHCAYAQSSNVITHYLHIGNRMAIGLAGTRGAPSQTLRRTHRGILKEYALKHRFGVTAESDRSDVSTAMEPEIGFLMANLALAGTVGGQRVLDPCCGSGSLLLYAAALGAADLVGVDFLSSVWESAKDEFNRHASVVGKNNNSNTKLAMPKFFHGDVLDPSATECLHTTNTFDAIVVDPPYNIGAPVLLAGQDARPVNYHHDDDKGDEEGKENSVEEAANDITKSILVIARGVLVDGGRLVFFLPVRGEEMHMSLEQLLLTKRWMISGPEEQLKIQFGRLQRFTPTFARWLVCMTKAPVNSIMREQ